MQTIHEAVQFIRKQLAGIYPNTEISAFIRILFSKLKGFSAVDLQLKANDILSEAEIEWFTDAINELKREFPIQYILGETEFMELSFAVNEHTLIPRPETEELVQLIINDYAGKNVKILDIGTGSGCIAIGLSKYLPKAEVVALDVSADAVLIARQNAVKNGAEVYFFVADILNTEPNLLPDKLDVIVSNPPYVTESEKQLMSKNVLDFEPHTALFVPDNDALLFYRKIAEIATFNLNKGGYIYFEINERKANETEQLLKNFEFKNIEIIKDIHGKNRIVKAQW